MAETFSDPFPESVKVKGARRQVARQEFSMRGPLLETLRDGPLSVPEIAARLGASGSDVLWWLMGLVRYGAVRPSEKADDEGFYRYELQEGK